MGRRKKPSSSGAASGAPAPPTRGAPAPPTTAPRWWATLTDEDPITLEPLGDLAIAPVEVNGRYFDAASLAAYLAESGRLEDPCTRAPLGRAACAALDDHLRRWTGDASRSVEKLFLLSERVRVSGARSDASEASLRRAAGATMAALFDFEARE